MSLSLLLPPSLPLCLCFSSYRVVPLLVSILFAAYESISRNKNFTDPINYAHFIFITRLHRPRRRDNSLMIGPLSWDVCSSPPPPSCCIKSRIVNVVSDSAMMDATTRHFEKNLRRIGLRLKRRDGINNNIFPGKQQPLPLHKHNLLPPPLPPPATLKAPPHSFLMVGG